MELFIFILICYGASNIMVFSSIFSKWRAFWVKQSPNFFGELFTCMICLPFWWGVIISFLGLSPFNFEFDQNFTMIVIYSLLNGFLGSGGTWLLHTLQEYLEKK